MNTKRLFLFICSLFCFILVQADTDKFFGSNNQLSNSHVNHIYQDKKGYIWICTENGLNVFNGIDFNTFTHIANDSTSLANNSVLSVLEDKKGRFWVGTTDESKPFLPKHYQFQLYKMYYGRQQRKRVAIDQSFRYYPHQREFHECSILHADQQ